MRRGHMSDRDIGRLFVRIVGMSCAIIASTMLWGGWAGLLAFAVILLAFAKSQKS